MYTITVTAHNKKLSTMIMQDNIVFENDSALRYSLQGNTSAATRILKK